MGGLFVRWDHDRIQDDLDPWATLCSQPVSSYAGHELKGNTAACVEASTMPNISVGEAHLRNQPSSVHVREGSGFREPQRSTLPQYYDSASVRCGAWICRLESDLHFWTGIFSKHGLGFHFRIVAQVFVPPHRLCGATVTECGAEEIITGSTGANLRASHSALLPSWRTSNCNVGIISFGPGS